MTDEEIEALIERLSDAGTGQAGTLQEELCWDAADALRQLHDKRIALRQESAAMREAIEVLRNNKRDPSRHVSYLGIRDNKTTRAALAVLLGETKEDK